MPGSDERAGIQAGKLAQVVADAIAKAAPIQATEHHAEKYRQLETFLEDLEQHTSSHITPFLENLLDSPALPDELRIIVEEAVTTPAQFSSIVTQLFLYGIVSQVLSASVQPFVQGVSNDLWAKAVADGISVPISPAVLATAAARGLELGADPTITISDAMYAEAAKSGTSKQDLDLQGSIVGTPPSPQDLFEMFRRKIIGLDGVKKGLAEGDTRDDWIDNFAQLLYSWPTPTDFVRAAVQAQLPYDVARTWAQSVGLDVDTEVPVATGGTGYTADMFGLLVSSAGRPPGPEQMASMAQRGIIGWDGLGANETTFEQGIAESDVKPKWTTALQQLAAYVPAVSEIGTLLERGAITKDQAVTLWQSRGVPDYLAEGYAYMAEQQHIGQDKLLARGQVLTGYYDGIFSHDQAVALLGDLGYRDDVAEQVLSITDFRREIQAINSVVRRISTLYTAHKLTATNAKNALIQVGISAAQADQILGTWEAVREQPIQLPSTREIGLAAKAGTLTEDEAMAELADLGYEPRAAAIVLSSYTGAQIKPLPPAGTGITG